MQQNQCDWCMRNLPVNNYWNHIDSYPWWIFWCTKHLYITTIDDGYPRMNSASTKESLSISNEEDGGWSNDWDETSV